MTGIPFRIITQHDVRASIERARRSLEQAAEEIVWQVEMEVWRTLGYSSWTAMRETEYGGAAFMVPRADRPELVARMRRSGLTQQEIADTAGVSRPTVANDLSSMSGSDIEVAPLAPITNARGQHRPASYAPRDAAVPTDETEKISPDSFFESPEEHDNSSAMANLEDDKFDVVLAGAAASGDLSQENVTAKSREAASKPRRRHPLPDSYWRGLHDLRRKAESITRLVADDRYAANRAAITGRNGSDVLRTLGMVSAAAAQLDPATLAADEFARDWWLETLGQITETLAGLGRSLQQATPKLDEEPSSAPSP